jgi:hypothetical protein
MIGASDAIDALIPVRAEAGTVPEMVRTLAITDAASFQAGRAVLRRITTLRTTIAARFAPHVTRAVDAHRARLADRRRLDTPLAEVEATLKQHLAAFTIAEDQRRAQAARHQTVAAEETRTARLWAEVEALEAAGAQDVAADLVADLVSGSTPAVVVLPAPVTAPGLERRVLWRDDVTDAAQIPRDYLTVDHAKRGGVVRALKGAVAIPGVRMWGRPDDRGARAVA